MFYMNSENARAQLVYRPLQNVSSETREKVISISAIGKLTKYDLHNYSRCTTGGIISFTCCDKTVNYRFDNCRPFQVQDVVSFC